MKHILKAIFTKRDENGTNVDNSIGNLPKTNINPKNHFQMKTIIPLLSVLTAFLFAFPAITFAQKKEKDKVLVNRVYTIEFTETGGKKTSKPIPDVISFKSNKLSSKFMTSENKLPASLYTVSVDSTSDPIVITFESESQNADGEELKWEGTITDDDVEGTAVISKKGKTKKEYSFSGNLQEKTRKK